MEGDGARPGCSRSRCPTRSAATGSARSRPASCCTRSAARPCPSRPWPRWRSAAGPVAAFGSPAQQRDLLAEVADGRVLTAALRDAAGAGVRTDGATLTGSRVGVPYAAQAHRILVPTDSGTAVIDPHGAGRRRCTAPRPRPARPSTPCGSTPRAALDWLAAGPRRVRPLRRGRGGRRGRRRARRRRWHLTAEHLRTREQFGRPLATFQAVAQQVADVYVIARTVHLAAVSTAWRLSNGLDADEDLAVAAYWLAAEVPKALQVCHHLHGGLGVDTTYPLHRYYSQAKDLARFVGGAAHRLDRLGARCSSN